MRWLIAVWLCGVLMSCTLVESYDPVDLTKVSDWEWLAWASGQVEVRTRSLTVQSYDRAWQGFTVTNLGSTPIVFEGAQLIGDELVLHAEWGARAEYRTVDPREERHVEVFWPARQGLIDRLGREPKVLLTIRLGDEEETMEILYRRRDAPWYAFWTG